MPRMPACSVSQAAAETTAQSRPAIAVPGVSIATVGSPAASAAVRQAATSGSTAITAVPVARAPARGGGAERADADRHEHRVERALELGEQRRVAVDHPRAPTTEEPTSASSTTYGPSA